MIVAFGILCLFGLFVWYVIEDLRDLLERERASEVGVDGSAPLGLGLAPFEHGMTATVDADTFVTGPK